MIESLSKTLPKIDDTKTVSLFFSEDEWNTPAITSLENLLG